MQRKKSNSRTVELQHLTNFFKSVKSFTSSISTAWHLTKSLSAYTTDSTSTFAATATSESSSNKISCSKKIADARREFLKRKVSKRDNKIHVLDRKNLPEITNYNKLLKIATNAACATAITRLSPHTFGISSDSSDPPDDKLLFKPHSVPTEKWKLERDLVAFLVCPAIIASKTILLFILLPSLFIENGE